MKKRLLSWVLIFVMCLSIFAGKDIAFANEYTNAEIGVTVNPLYKDVNIDVPIDTYVSAKGAVSSIVYKNTNDAASYVRKQMVNRESSITVTVKYDSSTTSPYDVYKEVYDKAVAYFENCTGQEGDALNASIYYCSGEMSSDGKQVQLTYKCTYFTTAAQEKKLTTAVESALKSLNLDGKSDYQKVRAIYDYICDNVDYDHENLKNNPNYLLMYTAYAALCNKTAVCQGYAVLFYRMCKDAGLSVRYISGMTSNGSHAWNIVKIGDAYYNADCTWDGQDVESRHNYFLMNTNDFVNHVRSSMYDTAEYHAQYPIASDSWEDYSLLAESTSLNNVENFNYTTINNQIVTNQATGRGKVLVFGNTGCTYTQRTIASLSKADFSDVDLIYVDANRNDKDNVTSFRDTYGSAKDDITYTYNVNGANYWAYANLVGATGSYPLIIYIDSDNKVKTYQSSGVKSAVSVRENINAYFGDTELMELSKISTTIKVNETQKLKVSVRGSVRNGQFFTWTSSNPSVVSVDANGYITGKKEGTATITCKANNSIYQTCSVKVSGVKEIEATSVKLNKTSASILRKETLQLTATILPANCKQTTTWSSSDTSVATVSSKGLVTAKAAGTTSIKVKVGNCTATCKLTVKDTTYNIKFYGNGSTSGSTKTLSNLKYSKKYALTANGFKKKGYTFTGWNTKEDGSGNTYKNKENVSKLSGTNEKTVKLYAQWKANKYDVKFYGNGSTSGSTKTLKDCKYNKSYNLTKNGYKKKGYKFTGWNTKADGSGKEYTDKQKISKLSSTDGKTIKLYAQWSRNTYKIKYELNKGTNHKSNPKTYHVESKTKKLKNPTRKGYTFKGWYTNPKFTKKSKVTEIKRGTTGNIKLYAKWVKK